jgi:hypothetical protein
MSLQDFRRDDVSSISLLIIPASGSYTDIICEAIREALVVDVYDCGFAYEFMVLKRKRSRVSIYFLP